ncbi:MAG: hypothetical protein ACPL1A_08495 [Candidatus Kapaibacteriota bacterium]
MNIDRICLLDNSSEYLKFIISLSKSLIGGGELRFLKEDKTEIKTWKIALNENEKFERNLSIQFEEIKNCFLVWNFIICSKNISVFNGMFKMDIYQGINPAKLTLPLDRNLKDIPPCAINKTISFTDALKFMVKNEK